MGSYFCCRLFVFFFSVVFFGGPRFERVGDFIAQGPRKTSITALDGRHSRNKGPGMQHPSSIVAYIQPDSQTVCV